MQFALAFNGRHRSIFLPYKTHKRNYFLLFTKEVAKGTILSVKDSPEIALDTFFRVGDLLEGSYEGKRCGYIFYSNFSALCHGTCIIAYSKQWVNAVNKQPSQALKPFGMNLMLRHRNFYIYHKKNNATLIVNPSLASNIKENLEI